MDAERIRLTLEQLSPRAAQALGIRLLDGRSRADCAAWYAISEQAFDLMLFRAALEYTGAPAPPPEEEAGRAAALAALLEKPSPDHPLAALRELGPSVREAQRAAERAYEASPAFQRETWIRRLLVVVIVALTAWFYWNRE